MPSRRTRCLRSLKQLCDWRAAGKLLLGPAAGVLALGTVLALPCLPAQASDLRRTAIVKAVETARPAVVNIHGEKTLRNESRTDSNEALRRVNGMGTGVVIDERGYVLTNYHVVEGVQKIQVTLADRASYVARIVSHDPTTDLAIIKIDAKELTVIDVGTSSDLMTGEPVIAVGNAFGYEHTVTRGIVSALHRTVQVTETQSYDDLIQTDASINPGNSGGPLLNIDGQMIGINVAVRAGAQGIGFAIPVDKAMAIAADLLSTRRVSNTWHGIVGRHAYTADSTGVIIDSVAKDSPASKCELKSGDVITNVGSASVSRPVDVERALLDRRVGEKVPLVVERDGRQINVSLVMSGLPDSPRTTVDPTWDVLGLKLEQLPANVFQQYRTRYRGGLSVKSVRPGSPAASQGIRQGDVLVGMHIWETISPDNVSYILNRADFVELDPIKFYILRGNETLYGHMQVSLQSSKLQ